MKFICLNSHLPCASQNTLEDGGRFHRLRQILRSMFCLAAMEWIAPSEKDAATDTLGKRLWEAADQFRANSGLTSAQ